MKNIWDKSDDDQSVKYVSYSYVIGPTNKVCGVYLSERRSNILSMTLKLVNPMSLHVGDRYRNHKGEVVPYAT